MGKRQFGTIIQIGNVLVSEDVVLEYFACDYPVCKGCCCIIGDSGAPLEEEELEPIEREYPLYAPLMREEGRRTVDEKGFFEIDRDGDIVTPLVPGSEECAFCHFEGENCFCAMERLFLAGKTSFRKPVSCWLYPIRITSLTGGGKALNVDRQAICKEAFEKGRCEGIRVYQFLREPLIYLFGEEFYSALSAAAMRLIASS
jgi:hypothetical protein